MFGRASAGQVKSLALRVGEGVPSDLSWLDAIRNLGDISRIHAWLRLGLTVDLGQVDMAAVEALVRPKILDLVATTTIPALPAFDVSAHFHKMTKEECKTAEVPIGFMNNGAKRLVKALASSEPEVAETTLRIHELRESSAEASILAELGETVQKTTLGQMYEMMKAQGHGEQGNLLTNGYANIFYVPDAEGTVWAVYCNWGSGDRYWSVYAYPVTSPNTWSAGRLVVSR